MEVLNGGAVLVDGESLADRQEVWRYLRELVKDAAEARLLIVDNVLGKHSAIRNTVYTAMLAGIDPENIFYSRGRRLAVPIDHCREI